MIVLIAWIIATPLSIALSIFALETLFGLIAVKPIHIDSKQPKTVILMPAHDEALSIAFSLEKLKPILSEDIKLLVVADNCSDETSKIVEDLGYDVVQRIDPDYRGKGHALAFGREQLRKDPPDCVIVFDADCTTDRQSISDLSKYCLMLDLPVQAKYVFSPDTFASPMVQISNFAFWVKNAVRQRGSSRFGAAALLTGTGMAFPWRLFENLPLATSNIVEDLGLGIHLTETGNAPIYLNQALINSLPASERATLTQRTRWEHGFIKMARQFALKALVNGALSANRKLFLLGLHLMVPPLALLFGLSILGLAMTTLLIFLNSSLMPPLILFFALFLAAIAIFLAWVSGGKEWIAISTFLKLPMYLLWKIPVYLKLVRGETPGWNRTER